VPLWYLKCYSTDGISATFGSVLIWTPTQHVIHISLATSSPKRRKPFIGKFIGTTERTSEESLHPLYSRSIENNVCYSITEGLQPSIASRVSSILLTTQHHDRHRRHPHSLIPPLLRPAVVTNIRSSPHLALDIHSQQTFNGARLHVVTSHVNIGISSRHNHQITNSSRCSTIPGDIYIKVVSI